MSCSGPVFWHPVHCYIYWLSLGSWRMWPVIFTPSDMNQNNRKVLSKICALWWYRCIIRSSAIVVRRSELSNMKIRRDEEVNWALLHLKDMSYILGICCYLLMVGWWQRMVSMKCEKVFHLSITESVCWHQVWICELSSYSFVYRIVNWVCCSHGLQFI